MIGAHLLDVGQKLSASKKVNFLCFEVISLENGKTVCPIFIFGEYSVLPFFYCYCS